MGSLGTPRNDKGEGVVGNRRPEGLPLGHGSETRAYTGMLGWGRLTRF